MRWAGVLWYIGYYSPFNQTLTMKKKTSQKLQLVKIKVANLSRAEQQPAAEKGRTLPTTQYISCGATFWVC